MSRKRRTLADNAEVVAATGKSVADWAAMLQSLAPPVISFSAIVDHLTRDCGLQIYWAHCIAHKLTDETDPPKVLDA